MDKQKEKPNKKSKKVILFIIMTILFTTLFLLYGRFFGTSGFIVNEIKITNSNIPNEYHGLKIIHLSDIHYGRTIKDEQLKNIVDKINIIKPDIVVLTGDLFDRDIKLSKKEIDQLTNNLKNINVKINKYAVMGNHDYKFDEWEKIINESNFIDLNNTYDLIYNNSYNNILISGMSTNLEDNEKIKNKLNKVNVYIETSKEEKEKDYQYKIMIMHEPDFINDFDYKNYDLILAGHSHNGQVRIPFVGAVLLPEGAKEYYKPHYKLDNTEIYISSGLGTSTFNFRLFNQPSINFYRLTNR